MRTFRASAAIFRCGLQIYKIFFLLPRFEQKKNAVILHPTVQQKKICRKLTKILQIRTSIFLVPPTL
jgi:hypothetical protein